MVYCRFNLIPGLGLPFRAFAITLRPTTVGSTPLDGDQPVADTST